MPFAFRIFAESERLSTSFLSASLKGLFISAAHLSSSTQTLPSFLYLLQNSWAFFTAKTGGPTTLLILGRLQVSSSNNTRQVFSSVQTVWPRQANSYSFKISESLF